MNAPWTTGDVAGMVAQLREHARQYAVDPHSGRDRRNAMRIEALAWIKGINGSDLLHTADKVRLTAAVVDALQQALDVDGAA